MYSRNYFFSIIIVSQRMNQIEKRIFYAILGVAFILRFYNLWNLPFTNDELSTLNRLNYNTFNELLKHAIWTDGHPAGVQSFLWFYTRTFGTNPLVVKLPFVILGFLSLPLYFFAAKNLTNTRTALFTLAFLATLQFPLFYSQTIRPYSSGQFFAALSIFLWSKHLLENENKLNLWKSLPLAFSIFLSLSNHYFNGFLVFYLLPIGLLLNRKNLNIHYLTPWISGAILYIPQFNIFFHQLKVGSPGWLQTPNFNSPYPNFLLIVRSIIKPSSSQSRGTLLPPPRRGAGRASFFKGRLAWHSLLSRGSARNSESKKAGRRTSASDHHCRSSCRLPH
jgi:uncharacterized membrane protein